MRKHLVPSAEYWFRAAKEPESTQTGQLSQSERVFAMEQAYNHVENALAYILEKSPEAKEIFDKVNKQSS